MRQEREGDNPKVLMLRAKNGDKDAFGLIYKLYLTPVFRYIHLRIGNKRESEDLAQIVFSKVFRSLAGFEKRENSPLAYFFTVARNTVIDYYKKKKDIVFSDIETIENRPASRNTDPARVADENEKNRLISQSMNALTDEQKEVIALKFTNELSNKEISAIMGKNESAIRQIQCRALKKLREHITA